VALEVVKEELREVQEVAIEVEEVATEVSTEVQEEKAINSKLILLLNNNSNKQKLPLKNDQSNYFPKD
jgi:hypothetical protein